MTELSRAIEVRPPAQPDPVKRLASVVIYEAMEDLAAANTDRRMEARRFFFSQSEDYRRERERWFMLAHIPSDCVERFRHLDAASIKQRLRGQGVGQISDDQGAPRPCGLLNFPVSTSDFKN